LLCLNSVLILGMTMPGKGLTSLIRSFVIGVPRTNPVRLQRCESRCACGLGVVI
jgi:hypothetical protein